MRQQAALSMGHAQGQIVDQRQLSASPNPGFNQPAQPGGMARMPGSMPVPNSYGNQPVQLAMPRSMSPVNQQYGPGQPMGPPNSYAMGTGNQAQSSMTHTRTYMTNQQMNTNQPPNNAAASSNPNFVNRW